MNTQRASRLIAAVGALALVFAACGGDDDVADEPESIDPESTDTGPTVADTSEPTTSSAGSTTTAAASDGTEPTETESTEQAGSAGYEPGPIGYRVVSLIDEPVDVYVRTTGLVEAFEAQMGVERGEVTEFFFPPDDGPLVITTAGAGDATCVASCDHIVSNISAFDGSGDVHTLLLYDASGQIQTYDLYEEPDPDQTNTNALVAADLSTGQLVAIAADVTDADFGMRLGYAGVDGCVDPVNLEGILVGGNQTPAFAYDGDSVDVLLYANEDRECADEPVGGPFTVEGGPGTRSMLLLTGSPGDMDALVVPFANSVEGVQVGGEDSASGADAETAYALMAEELSFQLGLDPADAECVAPYLVDAIGLDVALVNGELIDLDAADVATQDLAFDGLFAGVEACGIDPALVGG